MAPSHRVKFGMSRPFAESLSFEPEQNAEKTPQCGQSHVRHDRWDIAGFHDPWRNELAKAVSPDILVDGNGHEDAPCNRLVGIDSVSGGDSWESSDFDTCAGIADNDDGLWTN